MSSRSRFAVATPHAEATRAGVAAFEAGGNAVDAALAAAATLAVVYPHMCAIGGDLFALVARPGSEVVAVNASGAAPADIDVEAIRRAGDRMPVHGPLTITVPGMVSGWETLAGLGARLGPERALEPAIRAAEDGVPLARSVAGTLESEADRLAGDPGFAEVFFPGGRRLRRGETLRQPALARSLETLASEGFGALYGGRLGAPLAGGLRRLGSPIKLEDLAAHAPETTAPLAGSYRDIEVLVVPPNSQGFTLLEILAAVERLEARSDPLGPDAGLLARVFHLASLDRDRYLADPRRAPVPVADLLAEENIGRLCELARSGARADAPTRRPQPSGDTIALVTADAEGYAVSLIQSLFDGFGSGILEPSTGIICHSRGSAFSLEAGSPNALAGGKRPAHSLMPVLARRKGKLAYVGGTMGGWAQPQINAQVLMHVLDGGSSPTEAVSAPRWIVRDSLTDPETEAVEAEGRVPAEVRRYLEAAGFEVNALPDPAGDVGHAHAIVPGDGGVMLAGSDPRADGAAAIG